MSFAIPKAQKKPIFEQPSEIPGPSQYSPEKFQNNLHEHCAPFNSSEVKVSYFDVAETKYGPGSYNSKHIKDISKPMKMNKHSVFASKVERFKTQVSREEEKQEEKLVYVHVSADKVKEKKISQQKLRKEQLQKNKNTMNEIRTANHGNKIQSIKSNKEFVRVILTSSSNTEMRFSQYVEKDIMRKTLGPGSYKTPTKKKVKSISNWSCEKPQRFKSQSTFVPGPGTYGQQKDKKKEKQTSAFASNSLRSYMDTLIYKTNIPLKVQILQERKLKDKTPGPGSYNSEVMAVDKKSFNFGADSNFGYAERTTFEKEAIDLGPGSYNPILLQKGSQCNKTIKDRRNQIFQKKKKQPNRLRGNKSADLLMNNNNFVERKNNNRKQKQMKMCNLEERCFSKLGNMNLQERFKPVKVIPEPGPGEHQQIYQQMRKGNSAVFNSQTDRHLFPVKEDIPYYNLHKNDIGFKAEKTKRYLQNLKKINVEKSPFETSEKRFKNEEKFQTQFEDIIRANQQRPIKPKIQQKSSAFVSKTKRGTFTVDENKPGPADYDVKMTKTGQRQQLEKKSFNKYYNYHPIKEAVPKFERVVVNENTK